MSNLNDFLRTSGSQNYKLIPAPATLMYQNLYGVNNGDFPTSNGEINGWFTAPANCKLIKITSQNHSRGFTITVDGTIPNNASTTAIRKWINNLGTVNYSVEFLCEPGNDVRISLCGTTNFADGTSSEACYFEFYGEV